MALKNKFVFMVIHKRGNEYYDILHLIAFYKVGVGLRELIQ